VGLDFNPHTHPILIEKPAGISTESPYPQNSEILYTHTPHPAKMGPRTGIRCGERSGVGNQKVYVAVLYILLPLLHRYKLKLRPHQQQCRSNVRIRRSNIRLCRKNRSTYSIRQCCFDIVAGVDRLSTQNILVIN